MKVQTKWFLSAISAFVAVIVLSVITGFSTIKSNVSSKNGELLVSSMASISRIE